MIIKREQFLQELELREQIRKVIRVVKKKRALAENQEEQKLRMVIRQLIAEQEEIEPASDRPTGIRILDEEVLQNIVPIFEKYYKQLAKPEQRESFRTHIVNAVENLLATISILDLLM
jgi:lipopolysaccharide biosynthesis regulator YciM